MSDHALGLYQQLSSDITKDDIFYYVYGVLHSPEYRSTYASDLRRSLPRIPQVDGPGEFWTFSKAGRDLVHLHTEYETVDPWPGLKVVYKAGFDSDVRGAYHVVKMRHPKVENPEDPDGRKINDLTRINYNDHITIERIPIRAYDYVLGSRSALAWLIESNRIKTDTKSGITNNPNDWADEHDDPTYILDLVGRITTVSMRTLDIVDSLPSLGL